MKGVGLAILVACAAPMLFADDAPTFESTPDLISIEGYVLAFNAQGPASYVTSTVGELPPGSVTTGPVHAEACQHGLSLPFTANLGSRSGRVGGALGKGGYLHALETLQKENPSLAGIYDVQVDLHDVEILSIYSRLCTEITGRGYRFKLP